MLLPAGLLIFALLACWPAYLTEGQAAVPKWTIVAYPYGAYGKSCPAELVAGQEHVVAPVVIVAYNRPDYLRRTLESTLKNWGPDATEFPLFVSIDGGDESVRDVVYEFSQKTFGSIKLIQHEQDAKKTGYARLSDHYRYLLKLFFACLKYPRLLFVEDDLDLSPDFYSYFKALRPLLESDQSLWCISAWNDHAVNDANYDPKRVYRTDGMPGLGWMLRRDTGLELMEAWPDKYWDDWMRTPAVRKGRQCIFPEKPRTYSFGEKGTSGGQFWSQYIAKMKLNTEAVDWESLRLNDTLWPSAYDASLRASICSLPLLKDAPPPYTTDHVALYDTKDDFGKLAQRFNAMPDFRGEIPRMSYQGVVVAIVPHSARVFLVPNTFMQKHCHKG